jgi:hypothetical protein
MAMKPRRLARAFIWVLASLAIFLIFVVFDWYPTVKELGRLRREQRDVILKIKNFTAMASSFVFPDEEEKSHFVKSHADLYKLLMQADDDAPWLNRMLSWLRWQAEADKVDGALLLFSSEPGGMVAPGVRLTGQTPMADWLAGQQQDIQEFIAEHRLAGRPLAIAIEARLPVLLNFINHCSWDYGRLEIVRIRLEAGASLPWAWLVLRGYYLVRGPSPWTMQEGTGSDAGLLVDPDSPLLWQKVDPGTVYRVKKIELPAAASRGGK